VRLFRVTDRDTVHTVQVLLAEITLADTRPTLNNSLYPSQVHSGQQKTSGLNRERVKADSHIPCRSHAVPMPFPYHATNVPFSKRPLKAMAGSRQGDGMLTAG
jgi:hypothetical protein